MAAKASAAKATTAQTASSAPVAVLQRQCACGQHSPSGEGECDSCKKKRVSLSRHTKGPGPVSIDSRVRSALESPGQPLEKETRALMESRFHHDFSSVRVHTGARAEESAGALQANAYALGRDVVFARGQYNPASEDGLHLIAHELAHVVQQQHAPALTPQTELEVSSPGDNSEREAEAAADRVAEGRESAIQERAPSSVVHRELKTWEKVGLGALGVGAAIAAGYGIYKLVEWLTEDPTEIKDPPNCGGAQQKIVKSATDRAGSIVKSALEKIRAFQQSPNAPESNYVRERLNDRFHSVAPETSGKAERVINQISRLISKLTPKCHSPKFDESCSWAEAYVPDGKHVVFCASFFKESNRDSGTVIHETAHAVTNGGAHIGDRGYAGERILPLLSTEEALTNAESYAQFIQDLASGKPYVNNTPKDNIECPKDVQDPMKLALAKAERLTTNATDTFTDKSQGPKTALRDKFLPKEQVPALTKIFTQTNTALGRRVHIVCLDANNPACAKGPEVQFTAGDKTLNVCPAWNVLDADHQTTSLLAALYGALGGAATAELQTGLANIAQSTVRKAPTHDAVFGDTTWTPDALSIIVTPEHKPSPPLKFTYRETRTTHTRISEDLHPYQGPNCSQAPLPLNFSVEFMVDQFDHPRPGPFTPPTVSISHWFTPNDPKFDYRMEDSETHYTGEFSNLGSKLQDQFNLEFTHNGTFHMNYRMEDPDTKTVLVYLDDVQVQPDRPCPSVAAAQTNEPVGAEKA
jgi:Domain of unknown function (DUF4157)/Lysine-specific metallo-endopeptidase